LSNFDKCIENYKKEIYNSKTGSYDVIYLEIFTDQNPVNPRTLNNLSTMVFFHKKYELGDKTNISEKDFNSWANLQDLIYTKYNPVILKTCSMKDHGNLNIFIGTINPFNSENWDTGII